MARKKKQEAAAEGENAEVSYNNHFHDGSDEYSHSIKIPKDRIAVLIGVKGKDKRELEDWSSAKISVDSKEGDVIITGRDALKLYELKEIIQAIARGFSPETATLLMKPDYMLEIISLKDYGLDNPGKLARVKARIIGTGGKARRVIEELTEAQLCVYGKTIGIIGEADSVTTAKRAVELIIKGSMHSTVYKWLENQRRKAKRDARGF